MKSQLQTTPQDHQQGPSDAPYTLLEYGDYQCPSCKQVLPLIKKLEKHFGDKLRFVFRNFPLEQHEFAEMAAETAEFAAEHGKFWEMHDLLYKQQEHFSEELFPKLATQLGLDAAALTEALDSGKYAAKVRADLASGEKASVHATPSFYVNGTQTEAFDFDSLVAELEQ
jgi:protein-disulfide isomerase